jgi:hypothetical protein
VPTRVVLVGVVVATALVVGSCRPGDGDTPKPPEAFCDAATRFDKRVQEGATTDEQIRLVQRMVDAAPAKIKADAEQFLDALRRVESDPSVKDDPQVKQAVEDVNRYAAQGCGFYERRPGGI